MSISKHYKKSSELNVLVVQSESPLREHIREILEKEGYSRVTPVDTALNGLSILRTQPVDILVCSIDLVDLDGWRLSRLVRSGVLRCDSNIPIIVTTSTWCERIAEVTAREHGISALLPNNDLIVLPGIINSCISEEYTLSKPSLLVVEDAEDTALLIKRMLGHRFDIDIAYDGEAGLEKWNEKRHDLVLLDVMLPKLAGPDVLQAILSHRPNQPVVIMTAHASDQAEELLINGAADFITKPFKAELLRSVTDIALRRDDYLVSNQQFAARVRSLAEREAAYREISETHRHLLNNLKTVVMELNENLDITFLNEAWHQLLDYDVEESIDRPFKQFLFSKDGRKYRAIESRFRSVLLGNRDECEVEVALKDKKDNKHWVHLRVSRSALAEKAPTLTICLDDITKRKHAQEQLEYLAMHDSLTGLFNRRYFETVLEKLSNDAKRNGNHHGLIYLDLDFFKVINDSFGHHWGDEVLREVARLINKYVRVSDVLCRLGGDEFAVMLHDLQAEEILVIASDIQRAVSAYKFAMSNQTIDLGCSVGVSLIEGSAANAEEYLIQADIALYVAKHRGRNIVHLYDPQDRESDDLRNNIDWARQIRQAMADNRLVLYFQPVINIKKKHVSYYEALVRMVAVDGSLVLPGKFISALESTGDMALLDRWVITEAIQLLQRHPKMKKVAINLSAQAFRDENLVPIIRECLSSTGVDGKAITFEITESDSLFNLKTTQRVIDELHQLGCSFAVDDFGSGFSSFAYLKELSADYIKLDGSFICNLHKDKVDQALVRSIIEVVQALGRKTVAEFVENEEILQFLADNGVDYAQGYHIGRPMPVSEIDLDD